MTALVWVGVVVLLVALGLGIERYERIDGSTPPAPVTPPAAGSSTSSTASTRTPTDDRRAGVRAGARRPDRGAAARRDRRAGRRRHAGCAPRPATAHRWDADT